MFPNSILAGTFNQSSGGGNGSGVTVTLSPEVRVKSDIHKNTKIGLFHCVKPVNTSEFYLYTSTNFNFGGVFSSSNSGTSWSEETYTEGGSSAYLWSLLAAAPFYDGQYYWTIGSYSTVSPSNSNPVIYRSSDPTVTANNWDENSHGGVYNNYQDTTGNNFTPRNVYAFHSAGSWGSTSQRIRFLIIGTDDSTGHYGLYTKNTRYFDDSTRYSKVYNWVSAIAPPVYNNLSTSPFAIKHGGNTVLVRYYSNNQNLLRSTDSGASFSLVNATAGSADAYAGEMATDGNGNWIQSKGDGGSNGIGKYSYSTNNGQSFAIKDISTISQRPNGSAQQFERAAYVNGAWFLQTTYGKIIWSSNPFDTTPTWNVILNNTITNLGSTFELQRHATLDGGSAWDVTGNTLNVAVMQWDQDHSSGNITYFSDLSYYKITVT